MPGRTSRFDLSRWDLFLVSQILSLQLARRDHHRAAAPTIDAIVCIHILLLGSRGRAAQRNHLEHVHPGVSVASFDPKSTRGARPL